MTLLQANPRNSTSPTKQQQTLLSPQSPSRLSSSSSPHKSSSETFFLFLTSLRHRIDLILDENLIKDSQIFCDFFVMATNVPIRYLSIRNNLIHEVDKIKIAKLQIREIEGLHQGDGCLVNVGAVPVIDF